MKRESKALPIRVGNRRIKGERERDRERQTREANPCDERRERERFFYLLIYINKRIKKRIFISHPEIMEIKNISYIKPLLIV